jgi:uncharacterized SAM-binding protein YcdF (DUF218 family)
MNEQKKMFWGLLCRRQCLVPTLRGWVLAALSVAALALIGICRIGPFLTVSDSVPGGVLVVEGWVPDYVMQAAAAEFKQNHYAKLFVTGIPLAQGTLLSEYTNHAYVGAATLLKLGLTTNDVQAVPTDQIRRDRTYNMALSLKKWLREHDLSPTKVNLITAGPHSRRSRLLFEKALGKGVTVGVLAIPGNEYDKRHWWNSSEGVRVVIGEALAYGYARLLFYPPTE